MLIGELSDFNKTGHDLVCGDGFFNTFLLILICIFILQLKTLILQYILLLSIFFLDRPDIGIYFVTLLFFVYNHKLFFQSNSLKLISTTLIVVSVILFVINKLFYHNQYFYITSWVISMIMIAASIYCIFKLETDNKPSPPTEEKGGKIDVKKINLNFVK